MVDSEAMSQMLPSMLIALPLDANPLPEMVTSVPPPVPPLWGLVDVMVGVREASYVKEDARDTVPEAWTTATSQPSNASVPELQSPTILDPVQHNDLTPQESAEVTAVTSHCL